MKWFKHDSDANTDAKLKRLRMKYGMSGYGLYWYCLELIARNVSQHNLTFELEHDARIVAHDVHLDFELVEEMMRFMIELGLFELSGEKITCLKMLSRTDDYIGRIATSKVNYEHSTKLLQTKSEVTTNNVVVNRTEQNRKEKKGKRSNFVEPSIDELKAYIAEKGYLVDAEVFWHFYESKGWMVGKNKMRSWKSALVRWNKTDNKTNGTYSDMWKGAI